MKKVQALIDEYLLENHINRDEPIDSFTLINIMYLCEETIGFRYDLDSLIGVE